MDVQANLQVIKKNIQQACDKVGRNPNEITIIAVTKYVTIDRAQEAIHAGMNHLGENRLEGFSEKLNVLSDSVTWHFIGSLQTRKVKDIVFDVDYIHSLDRKSLAKEINKRTDEPVSCFVQVNVSGEESKHGIHPDDIHSFIESLKAYPKVKVVGLMTMAPFVEDEGLIRSTFRRLRDLRDEVREKGLDYAPCTYLSMGMSNDYEIAVEEGATHIRIGSQLVGSK